MYICQSEVLLLNILNFRNETNYVQNFVLFDDNESERKTQNIMHTFHVLFRNVVLLEIEIESEFKKTIKKQEF